ncbi:hypothetical protein [Pseudomonas citronellolis]|uniref:hypothetical protein n=1 Tax=Pseudomonas citronellolis TaxID=53408 RepID=UPI0023E3A148|nr:hypothetical protein [Pseudomonas citronellolis]MDF3932153.1 hypothetical protein [Pseudomonas citronellolis]
MLNGLPLNGAALNALWRSGSTPVPVVPPVSLAWACRVRLGVDNVTAQLTGSVRIEREEGAAAIAEFSLFLPAAGVDVISWTGRAVEIYFQHLVGGAWVEELRFSGWLEQPTYDPRNRIVACEATDRLQDLIEGMDVADIDQLAGGLWTEDVFEPVDGRSRWDYAQERMGTVPGSLDRAVDGTLRVTGWAAQTPIKVFGAGSTVDQSLSVEMAKLSERVNRVELSISYRFSRLRERHQAFNWEHPEIQGWSTDNSFCLWRHESSEVPTTDMVEEALNSAGYKLLAGAEMLLLPPTGVYCTPPQAWINNYDNLLLAANVVGGMRWVQPVTETYTLTVEAPESVAAAGEVLRRDGASLESDLDRADDWESAEFTAPDADAAQDALEDWVVDLREAERLAASVRCQLATAATSILSAHRANRVSWQVPTSMALGIDLVHSLRLEDRCRAQGKVFSIIDEFSIDQQTALSTLTLAISRGGGAVSDPFELPAPPNTQPTGDVPQLVQLPNQIRGRGLMTYDETIDGFSGNYDNPDPGSPPDAFPRRYQVTAPEVPAEHRDEFTGERETTYRVAVPDDMLEL